MKQIEIANGQSIPALGLGTWKMSPEVAERVVEYSVSIGYRHIDCAWIYENESGVGKGLKNAIKSGVKREDLWITSKLWNNRHEPKEVRTAIEESLQALQLECLDLYLMHWPVAQKLEVIRADDGHQFLSLNEAPLENTWEAMQQCVERGQCRAIGVSNFNIPKLNHLIDSTGIVPAVNQVESHPYLQQSELVQFCHDHSIAFTAYSPLGSGDRPEAMKRANEPSLLTNDVIKNIAAEHNATPGQILLAWAVCRNTIAIPKSANEARLQQNLAAADLALSNENIQQIARLDAGYRYVDGTFWELPNGPYTVDWLWNQ